MIRPGCNNDKQLLKEDLREIFEAKRLLEAAGLKIATLVQCLPLESNINIMKHSGVQVFEISRRLSAFAAALHDRWEYSVPFEKSYKRHFKTDDAGCYRFYDEAIPYAKYLLKEKGNPNK